MATHYCESSQIQQLEHALLQTTNATEVDDVINRFCPLIQLPFRLAKNMEQINECFDASCVMEILNRLEKDGSDWAKKITKVFHRFQLHVYKSDQFFFSIMIAPYIFPSDTSIGLTAQCECDILSTEFWLENELWKVFTNGL